MRGNLRDLSFNRDGTVNVTVTVDSEFVKVYDALKDVPVNVEIKKASKARSQDVNSFMWALCSDIGKAMTPPLAKEDVYRMAIKAVGIYTHVAVPAWQVKTLRQRWESNGTGWFMEIVDDFAIGSKWVRLYYGTSTYTADEIKPVVEWLKDQCEQMQIPIPLGKKEEQELYERWGKRVTGSTGH